ncbi:MAG: cupin domain-containing protein [Actinobacteria bacterium]|nr:cupin domain-containing protein [Actinomycetota bacterium]
MTRHKVMLALSLLAVLVLSSPSALAQAPGPVVASKHQQEFTQPPGEFDLVQIVQELAPGAETPPHSHGGNGQATVLEGEVVLRVGDKETTFSAGEGFVETAGEKMQVANTSSARARFVVAFVLPKGSELTTPGGTSSKPGPTVLSKHQISFDQVGPFDLIQLVQKFAPGAATPPHSHGGNGQVNVVEGEFELRTPGSTKRFSAGQGFTETADQAMQLVNMGTTEATMVVAFVLAKGAELTTARGAVELAATGPLTTVPLTATGLWLVVVGSLFRRVALSRT